MSVPPGWGGGRIPRECRKRYQNSILRAWMEFFSPLRGTSSKTAHCLLSYFFELNMDRSRLNTLGRNKTAFLRGAPHSFLYGSSPPPGGRKVVLLVVKNVFCYDWVRLLNSSFGWGLKETRMAHLLFCPTLWWDWSKHWKLAQNHCVAIFLEPAWSVINF